MSYTEQNKCQLIINTFIFLIQVIPAFAEMTSNRHSREGGNLLLLIEKNG